MLFKSKQAKFEEASALISNYIDNAAQRFNNLFLFNEYRNLTIPYCAGTMVHYAEIHFNVQKTILEMYCRHFTRSQSELEIIAYAYFGLAHEFTDESLQYYDSMNLLDTFSRIAEDPYNHVLDVRYGQLVYALRRFLTSHDMKLTSPHRNMYSNEAAYRFFVDEEPTIKPIVSRVLALTK